MEVRTIEDYLVITGLKPDDTLSKVEAQKIVNDHVISVYKGRVNLREDKVFTGYDIANKLHIIESTFTKTVEKAFEDEEESIKE